MNQYGFANGDPVSFSDPFGLCPEEKRSKDGTCPGGLTVTEWNKATSAAKNNLNSDAAARVLGLLDAGKISGARLDYDVLAEVPWQTGDEIRVNRLTGEGLSVFDYGPGDLAWVLGHESQHIEQLKGKTYGNRRAMAHARATNSGYRARVEGEADQYACAAAVGLVRLVGKCQ
jgi:hypothetical protein